MKSKLEIRNGIDYLSFKPNDEIGLMQLPVITKGTREGTNAWTWNGDLEKPTLRPSIRTTYHNGKENTEIHYWLNDGICQCLSDCKDGNANKEIALMEMPCGCLKCYPNLFPNLRFNVCPICGNKRCPHATDHNYECTNSNDVGQTGSAYGGNDDNG